MVRPSLRKEMAQWAVLHRMVSIRLSCRTFSISENCYRYRPKLSDENERIADHLLALTKAKKMWGFGLCYLYLRNVKGFGWNHKRVYRIYRELELNMRIKNPANDCKGTDLSHWPCLKLPTRSGPWILWPTNSQTGVRSEH